jgi:hypothetical protein
MYLYHFMINHVPTDLYRVKNPRMDVTKQGKNFSCKYQEMDGDQDEDDDLVV